tara:strand:- start:981 stop:1169 length:189 start_codon:yes stop_codon:yes gene_type:complete
MASEKGGRTDYNCGEGKNYFERPNFERPSPTLIMNSREKVTTPQSTHGLRVNPKKIKNLYLK